MIGPVLTDKVPFRLLRGTGSATGFTFVEVMVSMAMTIIVMGAVFALLARGFRTTDAEFERSDLQAQARHALDQISRDLLAAGSGLPPEFPAFTPPDVNPELDASGGGPEAIEIIGSFDSSAAGIEPWPIVSFDGEKARAESFPPQIGPGDLVLLYDDEPTNGTWMFGVVSSQEEVAMVAGQEVRELAIKTAPGDTAGETTLPSFIDHYNRPLPSSGFMTPVTVVSYKTSPKDTNADGGRVLWRQVNWGEPVEVAFVEDLQFRYFIGTTVADIDSPPVDLPRIFNQPPPPILNDHMADMAMAADSASEPRSNSASESSAHSKTATTSAYAPTDDPEPVFDEDGLHFPPMPQPDPGQPLQAGELVRGVGISVTSRSNRANLEGSRVRNNESEADDGFLRVTFASRVAARNVMFNLSSRENQGFN